MIKKIAFIAVLLSLSQFSLQAQDLGGGFKVGLNSSKFIAPVETDADGASLESFDFLTGFHVGGLVQLKFNKYFGVQAEVLFMQRGTSYTFELELLPDFPQRLLPFLKLRHQDLLFEVVFHFFVQGLWDLAVHLRGVQLCTQGLFFVQLFPSLHEKLLIMCSACMRRVRVSLS